MAFMMPVVKNDYNIYPSCPGSRNGSGTPSRGSSLSSSPTAASFISSPRSSQTPRFQKSDSQTSLHRFHSKVLDKLKKTFRSKDDASQQAGSSSINIR